MQVHFIDSITADNKVYVFRFTKDSYDDKYKVTLLTNSNIQPFTMALDPVRHAWKIERGVNVQLLIFENTLSNLIDEHNHRQDLMTSEAAHIVF